MLLDLRKDPLDLFNDMVPVIERGLTGLDCRKDGINFLNGLQCHFGPEKLVRSQENVGDKRIKTID